MSKAEKMYYLRHLSQLNPGLVRPVSIEDLISVGFQLKLAMCLKINPGLTRHVFIILSIVSNSVFWVLASGHPNHSSRNS